MENLKRRKEGMAGTKKWRNQETKKRRMKEIKKVRDNETDKKTEGDERQN